MNWRASYSGWRSTETWQSYNCRATRVCCLGRASVTTCWRSRKMRRSSRRRSRSRRRRQTLILSSPRSTRRWNRPCRSLCPSTSARLLLWWEILGLFHEQGAVLQLQGNICPRWFVISESRSAFWESLSAFCRNDCHFVVSESYNDWHSTRHKVVCLKLNISTRQENASYCVSAAGSDTTCVSLFHN